MENDKSVGKCQKRLQLVLVLPFPAIHYHLYRAASSTDPSASGLWQTSTGFQHKPAFQLEKLAACY